MWEIEVNKDKTRRRQPEFLEETSSKLLYMKKNEIKVGDMKCGVVVFPLALDT